MGSKKYKFPYKKFDFVLIDPTRCNFPAKKNLINYEIRYVSLAGLYKFQRDYSYGKFIHEK